MKSSQTSTRAGLNSRVLQDYFRQVLQIENSGRPANYGVEHAVRLVHVVAADELVSRVVRIHDVR
jgi:hypothetical protein